MKLYLRVPPWTPAPRQAQRVAVAYPVSEKKLQELKRRITAK